MRYNLDPRSEHTDEALIELLNACASARSEHAEKLNMPLEGGGSNLSAGQRQLVHGEGIAEEATVLVLDEATANLDMETDDLIQRPAKPAW